MRSRFTTVGAGLAACAATLALGACSGGGSNAGSADPTTVPPIVALGGSPGALASDTPSGGATNPGAGGSMLNHCRASGLKASTTYDPALNSGSTLNAYVVLTNTSKSACTVYGYAGLDFLAPDGKPLGMTTKRTNSGNVTPVNPVNLAPGQSAAERFAFPSAAGDQGNGCVNAGTISVIPPNETQALQTSLTNAKTGVIPYFGVCTSIITAWPFAPASSIPK